MYSLSVMRFLKALLLKQNHSRSFYCTFQKYLVTYSLLILNIGWQWFLCNVCIYSLRQCTFIINAVVQSTFYIYGLKLSCTHQFQCSASKCRYGTRLRDKKVRKIHLEFNLRRIALHKSAHVHLVFVQTCIDKNPTIAAPILGRKADNMDKSLN